MKHNVMVTIASLLSILFMTFHMTYDLRQAQSAFSNIATTAILVTWLYGTLVLAERRSRYVIILLGSILATGGSLVHMIGAGITRSSGFFFVWTLLALAVTGLFLAILSVRGLWSLQRGQPR